MNRRRFASLGAAIAATPLFPIQHSGAQTPEMASCSTDDLPLLEIEMTDEGFVVPTTVPAGMTQVSILNTGTMGDSHLFICRLNESLSDEIASRFLETGNEEGIVWEQDFDFKGAPDWPMPGGPAVSGIVNLDPGSYWIVNLAEFEPREVGKFTVEGADAAPTCEPDADVNLQLMDFHFMFDTPELPSGPTRWRIENIGALPHDIALIAVSEDLTKDDLMTLFTLDEGATPPPDIPAVEYLPVAAIGVLVQGGVSWLDVDLPVGRYLGLCMLPFGTGYPHAFEGMMEFINVE